MKLTSLFILLLLVISSCNSEENELPKVDENLFRSDYPEGEALFDYKDSVDRLENFVNLLSLEFTSDQGVRISSSAKLDSLGTVQVIKLHTEYENSIDEEVFYYKGGMKYISFKSRTQFEVDHNYYSETISFYTDTGNVIYSGIRNGIDPDTLELLRYSKIEPVTDDDNLALQLLKQEGPFQTNFLGNAFAEEQEKLFIVVGALDRSFTSTLAVNEQIDFIDDLIENEEKYKGRELKIEFMHTTQTDGFSFQTLLNAELLQK